MRARAAPPSPAVFEIAFESMRTNSMTTKVLALNLNGNLSHYVGSERAVCTGARLEEEVPTLCPVPRPGQATHNEHGTACERSIAGSGGT